MESLHHSQLNLFTRHSHQANSICVAVVTSDIAIARSVSQRESSDSLSFPIVRCACNPGRQLVSGCHVATRLTCSVQQPRKLSICNKWRELWCRPIPFNACTLYALYSIFYAFYSILYALYSIFCTLYSILYTPYSILYAFYSILYAFYSIFYALYSIHTLYSLLHTLYTILYTLYFLFYTLCSTHLPDPIWLNWLLESARECSLEPNSVHQISPVNTAQLWRVLLLCGAPLHWYHHNCTRQQRARTD